MDESVLVREESTIDKGLKTSPLYYFADLVLPFCCLNKLPPVNEHTRITIQPLSKAGTGLRSQTRWARFCGTLQIITISFSRVNFSTFLKFSGQNIFREWMEILTKNHLEHIIINLYLFVIMTDSMLVL